MLMILISGLTAQAALTVNVKVTVRVPAAPVALPPVELGDFVRAWPG